MTGFSRREATKLLGAALMTGGAGYSSRLHAQSRSLVVGTYGGDYQATLDKAVTATLRAEGMAVSYDVGSDSPRKTKLRAEGRLRRGTCDVHVLPATGCFELEQAGLLEPLDESKIPNLRNVYPALRNGYSAPHIQTFRVILYNRNRVTTPITAFNDLWKPELAPSVGLVDIHFHYNIETAALAAGGSMTNYGPGYDKLLELKRLGARLTPTVESLGQALGNGEILIAPMWQARAAMWQRAGLPIAVAYPAEGLVVNVNSFVVPKNAQNKEAAYQYINAALDPRAQASFAQVTGNGPTVNNAGLDAELARQTAYPDHLAGKVLVQDHGYFSANVGAMKDWWDRTYKA